MTTPIAAVNSHSANLLFSTRFAGITINNPDTFNGNGVWRHISGTDLITGFSHTDLAAAPLYVQPPGGGITGHGGYGLYYINQVSSPAWPTNDLAGVENKCQTTSAAQTIRGVSTNYLKMNWSDSGPSGQSYCQSWLAFHRDLSVANDLPSLCIREWITLQDYSTKLDATYRYATLVDIKTGLPGTGGDFRYTVGLVRSNAGATGWTDESSWINPTTGIPGAVPDGTMGWICYADSNANDPALSGVNLQQYFRVKNFNVPVPVNEAFQLEVYFKRSTSHADVNSGRLRVVMRKQDGTEYVLFDITRSFLAAYEAAYPHGSQPAPYNTPYQNIHMGPYSRKIERVYAVGSYLYGKANQSTNIQFAGVDIYDDIPYYLPAAA